MTIEYRKNNAKASDIWNHTADQLLRSGHLLERLAVSPGHRLGDLRVR